MRAKLAETFDYGTHRFTDAIDSDGHGNGPFHLRLALTRERGPDGEDRFIFDATETDDQSPGPVNLLLNPDVPGTALSMFYLGGDPAQVCNAGGPQALDEVRLREGSLLWPKFPAPLGMRGLTLMRFLAAVNGLINVAGGKAPAAHSAYVISFMRGTYRNDKGELEPFLMSDGIGVGWGARPTADGTDAVYFVAQENYPVEFLEIGYPVRLRTYGILVDSCGAGRYRGGCGIVREYDILAEEAMLAVRIDSVKNPPWGIDGGMAGGVGPRRRQSRHQPRARAGAAVRRQHAAATATCCASRPAAAAATAIPSTGRPSMWLDDVLGGFVTAEAAHGSTASRLSTARSTNRPRPGCAPGGRRPRRSTATPMSTALADESLAVAVDIGGTFTDIALHDANERPDLARQDAQRAERSRRRPS